MAASCSSTGGAKPSAALSSTGSKPWDRRMGRSLSERRRTRHRSGPGLSFRNRPSFTTASRKAWIGEMGPFLPNRDGPLQEAEPRHEGGEEHAAGANNSSQLSGREVAAFRLEASGRTVRDRAPHRTTQLASATSRKRRRVTISSTFGKTPASERRLRASSSSSGTKSASVTRWPLDASQTAYRPGPPPTSSTRESVA